MSEHTGESRPRTADQRSEAAGGVSPRSSPLPMLALALGGFGIGTAEFSAMGVLRDIAESFGTTEAQAGYVIAAYALGVVVGAPLIALTTGSVRRRTLLLVLMSVFTVANVAAALAPSLPLLAAARFFAGMPHGAYFGVAALVAADLAGPGKSATAAAKILGGLSVAAVIGVPAASWLGGALNWRWAFVLVVIVGVITVTAIAKFVSEPTSYLGSSPRRELAALKHPQVLATLAVATLGFGGMFAVYSYVTWTVTEVSGIPRSLVWIVLAVYGLGMVTGNFVGGYFADLHGDRAMIAALIAMTVVLALMPLAAQNPFSAVVAYFAVGAAGSALVPGLQARLMAVARDAQTMAAVSIHAALNIANAMGAWAGGLVIAAGLGYTAPAVLGAGFAIVGLVIAAPAAWFLSRSASRPLAAVH